VSAATLIKRFGSKEQLFLRLSQRWAADLDGQLREVAAGYYSPLARFRAVALHSYHDLDRPDTAAKQLAALAVDLQHDEMRGAAARRLGSRPQAPGTARRRRDSRGGARRRPAAAPAGAHRLHGGGGRLPVLVGAAGGISHGPSRGGP
jgi:AcrR family transcriptional regulator